MAVWRCPHCATPQAETSRCWVCRRSTTSCATCRHFRRGVAGGLGLCGRNPRHAALSGTEMQACWTAAPSTAAPMTADPGDRPLVSVGPGRRHGRDDLSVPGAVRQARTFVPVESIAETAGEPGPAGTTTEAAMAQAAAISPATGSGGRVPGTWWLWGDPEPWPEI